MPKESFPCPACGAPVNPAPNRDNMPCPFCGSALTIPANLLWQQSQEPENTSLPGEERPTFDPFAAAANARFSGEKAQKAQDEREFVTETLRKAQPIATGAVSAFAVWAALRRFIPGCLIALVVLCTAVCGIGIMTLVIMRQGGG